MPTTRRLDATDYDRIIALWRRSGLTSLREAGRDSREAFAAQLCAGQIVLGLEDGDELLGVVVVTHDTRRGWINHLAVDPKHRRRGYGAMLNRAAEETLAELGMSVIAVLVESWNHASISLLDKEGYQIADDILYATKRSSPEA